MPNNSDYITRTVSSSTYCTGTDRYCDVEVQVSYDNGSTWTTSSVTPTFIDHKASECIKVAALNGSGHTIGMVSCNNSTSLTSAETYKAFNQFKCSIKSFVFGGCSVTRLEDYAFDGYKNVTSITVPSSVTYIGYGAFGTYTFQSKPNQLIVEATTPPDINAFAFNTSINDPEPNVIKVPCSALYDYLNDTNWIRYYDRIYTIENCVTPPIPNNVKIFCVYLYGTAESLRSGSTLCDGSTVLSKADINNVMGGSSNKLREILIGDCITSISAKTFYDSQYNLLKVYIPDTVTSIGYYAFYNCYSIQSINIPSGVTSIEDGTFQGCHRLSSVIIPSGVTSIGERAFYFCERLTSITCLASVPPTIGSYAFPSDANIYVPAASVSAYQSAWSSYASKIQAIS